MIITYRSAFELAQVVLRDRALSKGVHYPAGAAREIALAVVEAKTKREAIEAFESAARKLEGRPYPF